MAWRGPAPSPLICHANVYAAIYVCKYIALRPHISDFARVLQNIEPMLTSAIRILTTKHNSTLKVYVYHNLLNLFISPPSPGFLLPRELPFAASHNNQVRTEIYKHQWA
jgi:hypothetical protein